MAKTLLEQIMNDPMLREAFDSIASQTRAANYASRARDDYTPDWLVDAIAGPEGKKSEAALIEDKVNELRQRVMLDSISKTASKIPLFKLAEEKSADAQLEEVHTYVEDFCFKRRGRFDIPALMFELKGLFGDELIKKNESDLKQFVDKCKERFLNDTPSARGAVGPETVNPAAETEENRLFQTLQNISK